MAKKSVQKIVENQDLINHAFSELQKKHDFKNLVNQEDKFAFMQKKYCRDMIFIRLLMDLK